MNLRLLWPVAICSRHPLLPSGGTFSDETPQVSYRLALLQSHHGLYDVHVLFIL